MMPDTAPRHSLPAPSRRPALTATFIRIVAQLRRDPRTIALILVIPAVLLTLLYYVFIDVETAPGAPNPFTRIGPIMLAVLPMLMMFIITSVAMLRERTSGTLERLMTTSVSRWNLLASYAVAFGLLGLAQASVLGALILGPFDVAITGPWWALLLLALLDALVGVSFGLLASAFARTEFQAVQFMPALIGPQIFLCGLLVPTDQLPSALEAVADWLPMTWAVDVVVNIMSDETLTSGSWWRLAGLAALAMLLLVVGAASMPRQSR